VGWVRLGVGGELKNMLCCVLVRGSRQAPYGTTKCASEYAVHILPALLRAVLHACAHLACCGGRVKMIMNRL
jgi:hypothetical protein